MVTIALLKEVILHFLIKEVELKRNKGRNLN